MKHTPGKWHIGREQDHSADRFKRNAEWARIRDAENNLIATINSVHPKGKRQSKDFDIEASRAALIAAAPELAEKLRESIDLLIGAAAWLKSSGQPMVAQGLRKWVAEHGQPALDRAEGVQDAKNDKG